MAGKKQKHLTVQRSVKGNGEQVLNLGHGVKVRLSQQGGIAVVTVQGPDDICTISGADMDRSKTRKIPPVSREDALRMMKERDWKIVLSSPFYQTKLTMIRNKNTKRKEVRELVAEVTNYMVGVALENVPTREVKIKTPVCETMGLEIACEIILITVLRAGDAMVWPAANTAVPTAKIGVLGMYRDPVLIEAVDYYNKLPEDIGDAMVLIMDPMLASAASAIDAIESAKQAGAKSISYLCLFAAPEGIKALYDAHPDIKLYVGALDDGLNEHCYIVPGAGDMGDRLFGTK